MNMDLTDIMGAVDTVEADRGPSHHLLQDFVGRFHVTGVNGNDAAADHATRAPDRVDGEESYEWWNGGFFLVNRFDRPATFGPFNGLGWIGYDRGRGGYSSYSINNLGFVRLYAVSVDERSLTFTGARERGRVQLSSDNTALTIRWERLVNGNWQMLCDLLGRRQS